jgi:hypothetical protein
VIPGTSHLGVCCKLSVHPYPRSSSSEAGHTVFTDTRPEVTVPSHEPLFTTDTDIAIPHGAALPPKQLLEQLSSYGFVVSDSSSQGADPISVRVPNAVVYIAQKLVILRKRKPSERAKDLLYIHDTIELFGVALESLAALWQTTVRPRLERIADEVQTLASTQFSEVTDDIRGSSRVAKASGRDLDPEIIRLRCAVGLSAIFSETRKS